MEDIETQIYNLIKNQEQTANPKLFILINPNEIALLEENNIKIKGIRYHKYDKWNSYQSYNNLLKSYQEQKYDNDIYDDNPSQIFKPMFNQPSTWSGYESVVEEEQK